MNNSDKVVVITGGGTGGHLSIARSFIDEFYTRDYKIIFIGSTKGQDRAWFEDEPKLYKKYFFDTRGVVNQNFFGKINSLFMIARAIVRSIFIFKKYKVQKIISVGGFSAAPASFGAIITNKDFYIHEQNSVMGKLNKITSKRAKEIFSSYLPTSKVKDYPINQEFFKYQRVRENIKTIIFLGGSQGASAINDFAIQIASILKEKNISIIHQCGKKDYEKLQIKYKKLNIEVDLFDFSTTILQKMQKADFAVSRSGASTLWELTALGIPTLFIPYPYAAANHQYYNALFLKKQKLCYIVEQDKLNKDIIIDILKTIDLKYLSENLIKTINKDGIKKIVNIIIN